MPARPGPPAAADRPPADASVDGPPANASANRGPGHPSLDRFLVNTGLAAIGLNFLGNAALGPFDPGSATPTARAWLQVPQILGLALLALVGLRRHRAEQTDRSPLVLALALAAQAVGMLVWTAYNLRGVPQPFPSPADLAFQAFTFLLLVGMACLLAAHRRRLAGVDLLLGIGFPAAVAALFWIAWQAGLFTSSSPNASVAVVNLVRPLEDALSVSIGFLVLLCTRSTHVRRTVATLVLGFLILLASDLSYLIQTDAHAYFVGDWTDQLYLLSILVMSWSIVRLAQEPAAAPPEEVPEIQRIRPAPAFLVGPAQPPPVPVAPAPGSAPARPWTRGQQTLLLLGLVGILVNLVGNAALNPLLPDPGRASTRYELEVAQVAGLAMLFGLGLWRLRHSPARQMPMQGVLVASIGLYGFGMLVWTLDNLRGRDVPFPSVAGIGFQGHPIAIVLGTFLLARYNWRRLKPGELVLVAAFSLVLATLFCASLLAGPLAIPGTRAILVVNAILRPALDVVSLCLCLLTLITTTSGSVRRRVESMVAGLILLVAGDVALFAQYRAGTYFVGNWTDQVFLLALLPWCLAVLGEPPSRTFTPLPTTARVPRLPFVPRRAPSTAISQAPTAERLGASAAQGPPGTEVPHG